MEKNLNTKLTLDQLIAHVSHVITPVYDGCGFESTEHRNLNAIGLPNSERSYTGSIVINCAGLRHD